MRLSQQFGRTLRAAPADASLINHQLAVRAGLARPLAAGVWSYLPLGWRVVRRIEAIRRSELAALGAQEMHLPTAHPAEEALAALCAQEVESYKDLPRLVSYIQPRTRDSARAKAGLFGLRESLVAGAVSLHAEAADLDAFFPHLVQTCRNVFERCGITVLALEAGDGAQAFTLAHAEGSDRFVRCQGCGYAASFDTAAFARREARYGDPQPVEKVATPGCKTIDDLCAYLHIEPQQTLKVVFYALPGGQPVMVLLRGDLGVSEAKLAKRLSTGELAPASEEAIAAAGAVAGYASPIGLAVQPEGGSGGLLVIADESLRHMSNFVTGANDAGYHMVNANYPRDFAVTCFADVAEPYDGAACPRCGEALRLEAGFELGRCTQFGAQASLAAGATYLDAQSVAQPIVMGGCEMALDRLLAAAIEAHHDDYGIIWPRELSPYDVHLVALAKDAHTGQAAETLYDDLLAAGIEALYDDRSLSPGVMFADADLVGIPLRLTVSARSLQNGGVEFKWRHSPERDVLPLESAVERIAVLLSGG